MVISNQVFSRLQIANNTIPIVKNNGYTVFAVTWCVNDLATDSNTVQEASALCTTNHLCHVLIYRLVIQSLVSEKNLIGEMNRTVLNIYNQKRNPKLLQLTDDSDVIRMVVSGQHIRYIAYINASCFYRFEKLR